MMLHKLQRYIERDISAIIEHIKIIIHTYIHFLFIYIVAINIILLI